MDSVIQAISVEESQRRDALVGRIFQSVLEAQDLFHIYLGSQLGLYDALRSQGWATSADLAEATQLSERYVREWLEQQAVSGLLDVEDVGRTPTLVATRSPQAMRRCCSRRTA